MIDLYLRPPVSHFKLMDYHLMVNAQTHYKLPSGENTVGPVFLSAGSVVAHAYSTHALPVRCQLLWLG